MKTMIKLLSIADARNYRQFSKQVNTDSFNGYIETIQQNELCDVLGDELHTDFFDFLENDFISYAGTFTRDSATQITIQSADVSSWTDYSLKINSEVFVIVQNAVFGGTDTILTVTGYDLPETITILSYSAENSYIKLLNGTVYQSSGNNIRFYELRPYLSWFLFVSYATDGNFKQADVGNVEILGDMFRGANKGLKSSAKQAYLENATREYNRIVKYLNENYSLFPLWDYKKEENIVDFDFDII